MSEILKEIREDVKEIRKDLTEVHTTNAIQNEQLKQHMRRTEIAEKRLDRLDKERWIVIGAATFFGVLGKFLGWF